MNEEFNLDVTINYESNTIPLLESTPCGLCNRCEIRINLIEQRMRNIHTYQPRAECGLTHTSVSSCYMYMPPRPMVLQKTKSEEEFTNITGIDRGMSSRFKSIRFYNTTYNVYKNSENDILILPFSSNNKSEIINKINK